MTLYAFLQSYHQRIYKFIRDEVGKGRQAYVICPAIEESEKLDVIAATTYAQELKDSIFSDLKVECIHGKMKADEKQKIMESFSVGEIDILVSTTVIEVGINVPNSTIMLIENAERFGLRSFISCEEEWEEAAKNHIVYLLLKVRQM